MIHVQVCYALVCGRIKSRSELGSGLDNNITSQLYPHRQRVGCTTSASLKVRRPLWYTLGMSHFLALSRCSACIRPLHLHFFLVFISSCSLPCLGQVWEPTLAWHDVWSFLPSLPILSLLSSSAKMSHRYPSQWPRPNLCSYRSRDDSQDVSPSLPISQPGTPLSLTLSSSYPNTPDLPPLDDANVPDPTVSLSVESPCDEWLLALPQCDNIDAIFSPELPPTATPCLDPVPPSLSLSTVTNTVTTETAYMCWYLRLPRYVLRVGSFADVHGLKQYLTFLAGHSLGDIEAEEVHIKAGRALSARKCRKKQVRPEKLHLSSYIIQCVIIPAIRDDVLKPPHTMVRDLMAWEQHWGLRDIDSYNNFLQIFFHFQCFHDAIASEMRRGSRVRGARKGKDSHPHPQWEQSHWVTLYRACEDRRVQAVRPTSNDVPCDADLQEAILVLNNAASHVSYCPVPRTVWEYRTMEELNELTNLTKTARPFPGVSVSQPPVAIFRMESTETVKGAPVNFHNWFEEFRDVSQF